MKKKVKEFYERHLLLSSDIRKQHFAILALAGIPLLIIFGTVSILATRNYWQALFNLPICISLAVSLFIIDKVRDMRILFRVNAVLFGILLCYLITTGGTDGSKMQWLHIYPLAIYFLLGRREGMVWNTMMILSYVAIFLDPAKLPFVYDYTAGTIIRFLTTYICISSFTHLFDYYRETYRNRLLAKTAELQNALDKVKTLSGYLPVCASCKKVREKDGSWVELEDYIRSHSGAEISHGLCDSCARELYPSIMEEITSKGSC